MENQPYRVVQVHRDRYLVRNETDEYYCVLTGSLRYRDAFPVVGDYVEIMVNPYGDSLIQSILPRRTAFFRPDLQEGRIVRRAGAADVEQPALFPARKADCRGVLLFRDAAREAPALRPHAVVGRVLVHHREVAVVSAGVPHRVEHGAGVISVARQDEVAHHDPPLEGAGHAVVAIGVRLAAASIPKLPHHLLEGRAGNCRVVTCARERAREARIGIFEVGEPHIHHVPQRAHHLHGLIARGIAHDGQPEAMAAGQTDRLDHMRGEMQGRHEVDVERTLILELEHHVREACGRHLEAEALLRDLVVLAEDAAQRAAREEDGARAALARDRRLFPEVEG